MTGTCGHPGCAGFGEALSDVADDVFRSLPRADQRRWAEIYVRGLLTQPGRKSVRRIASSVRSGTADQALQQFVSQSPWDPGQVRHALALTVQRALPPAAWVLQEVAIAKHGRLSPGVDRQFVRAQGRVSNCQLGLSLALTDGRHSTPIDWRLMMPASWDADPVRRSRARVPDAETNQPCWRHAVNSLDETSAWTGVHDLPVVCEAPVPAEAVALRAGLEDRQYEYLIKVSGDLVAVRTGSSWRVPRELPGGPGTTTAVPLSRLAREIDERCRHSVVVRGPGGQPVRSEVAVIEVRLTTPPYRGARRVQNRCFMLAEWPRGQAEPRGFWLTNLVDRSPHELLRLSAVRRVMSDTVGTLHEHFGLGAYEGRSYLGWHHHMTLVSVAYAVSLVHAEACPPCDVPAVSAAGSSTSGRAPENLG